MKRRMVPVALAASAALAVALTGCSSSGSTTDPALQRLQDDVLAVTRSAAAHDTGSARAELATLSADVARFRSAGQITAARAGTIDATIALVQADLNASSAPTPTPTVAPRTTETPTPTPTPSSSAPTVPSTTIPQPVPKTPPGKTKKSPPPAPSTPTSATAPGGG